VLLSSEQIYLFPSVLLSSEQIYLFPSVPSKVTNKLTETKILCNKTPVSELVVESGGVATPAGGYEDVTVTLIVFLTKS
jgi:hypothetical protein